MKMLVNTVMFVTLMLLSAGLSADDSLAPAKTITTEPVLNEAAIDNPAGENAATDKAEVENPAEAEPVVDELLQAVQIYSQDELLDLIKNNQHLERVKSDRCQLNRDIEDRAVKVKTPAYQFLYGDMLAWGVCIERNAELGLFYIRKSADQGLVAAIEQLGRYYDIGRFVQKDQERAYQLIQRAASLGNLNAQFRLVQMHIDDIGSPYDFENSYRWLHHAIIADQKQHEDAANLLSQLSVKMNPKSVKEAKKRAY